MQETEAANILGGSSAFGEPVRVEDMVGTRAEARRLPSARPSTNRPTTIAKLCVAGPIVKPSTRTSTTSRLSVTAPVTAVKA